MSVKAKKITGWVLTGLLALVFIATASMKLFSNAAAGSASVGLTPAAIMFVGVLELVCIVLFILPRTGVLGTLLLAAYLGGAIVTHLEHQQPFLAPVIIQALVWITAVIRFPELTRRISGELVAA